MQVQTQSDWLPAQADTNSMDSEVKTVDNERSSADSCVSQRVWP